MSDEAEIEALRRELEAKRKARSDLQEREAAKVERDRLRYELEAEDHISGAIAEHGPLGEGIAVLHTGRGSVIVRRPSQPAWRRFSDGGEVDGPNLRTLVMQCVVWPERSRVDEILSMYPAALEQLGGAVSTLAAARAKDDAGKS